MPANTWFRPETACMYKLGFSFHYRDELNSEMDENEREIFIQAIGKQIQSHLLDDSRIGKYVIRIR